MNPPHQLLYHRTVRIVDLSHEIQPGIVTYPGLPGPSVEDHVSFDASHDHYAAGTEFQIKSVSFVTSTGTYLDAPAHRFRNGNDAADLSLDRCVELPLIVVDSPAEGTIGGDLVPDFVAGHAVLFRTCWDRQWNTARYGSHEHPHLSLEAAEALVERGAAIAGIDSVNIDGTDGDERPVHTSLLGAGILIVENLCGLDQLPRNGASFTAAPLAFRSLPSVPVRAYAQIP